MFSYLLQREKCLYFISWHHGGIFCILIWDKPMYPLHAYRENTSGGKFVFHWTTSTLKRHSTEYLCEELREETAELDKNNISSSEVWLAQFVYVDIYLNNRVEGNCSQFGRILLSLARCFHTEGNLCSLDQPISPFEVWRAQKKRACFSMFRLGNLLSKQKITQTGACSLLLCKPYFNGSQLAKMKKSIPDWHIPAMKYIGMRQLV